MFPKKLMLAYKSLINQSRLFGCVGMTQGNLSKEAKYYHLAKDDKCDK